jgi:putative restriction endonuclease
VIDELAFRETAMAWLRARMLVQPVFSRDDLAEAEILGEKVRLASTQTGIWKPRQLSAALSILTGYYPDGHDRPYADNIGDDEMFRYKWRGTDPDHADNRALRAAMNTSVPMMLFVGVGYRPGTHTQVFEPVMPVFLIGEEPHAHQFVVALEADQAALARRGDVALSEIERRYNLTTAMRRLHQPMFRSRVLVAYGHRCAVCRLPFTKLLDAAHIKSDSSGGSAAVSNGLSLCKIHHGAFDTNIMGISADYRIAIKDDVLATFDGPTLQHSLKEVHGSRLAQLPTRSAERPQRELLDERYQTFLAAS